MIEIEAERVRGVYLVISGDMCLTELLALVAESPLLLAGAGGGGELKT